MASPLPIEKMQGLHSLDLEWGNWVTILARSEMGNPWLLYYITAMCTKHIVHRCDLWAVMGLPLNRPWFCKVSGETTLALSGSPHYKTVPCFSASRSKTALGQGMRVCPYLKSRKPREGKEGRVKGHDDKGLRTKVGDED